MLPLRNRVLGGLRRTARELGDALATPGSAGEERVRVPRHES